MVVRSTGLRLPRKKLPLEAAKDEAEGGRTSFFFGLLPPPKDTNFGLLRMHVAIFGLADAGLGAQTGFGVRVVIELGVAIMAVLHFANNGWLDTGALVEVVVGSALDRMMGGF